jgi:hypothetical protein
MLKTGGVSLVLLQYADDSQSGNIVKRQLCWARAGVWTRIWRAEWLTIELILPARPAANASPLSTAV